MSVISADGRLRGEEGCKSKANLENWKESTVGGR